MNTDIAIAVSFRDHRKRKRLEKKLGAAGVLALVDLWLFAGESRPDGVLRGMSNEDIADEARWPGDPDEFVKTLKNVGWLEKKGKNLVIHDWDEHNYWATKSEERTWSARRAAHVRWLKDKGIRCSVKGCEFCARNARRNAEIEKPHSASNAERNALTHLHTHTHTQRAREAADAWNSRAEEFGKKKVSDAELDSLAERIVAASATAFAARADFSWSDAITRIHPQSWRAAKADVFNFAWFVGSDGQNAIRAFDGEFAKPERDEHADSQFNPDGTSKRVVI